MTINTAIQLHKPFFSGIEINSKLDYLKRINVSWWLARSPMVLLAAPSAYGVGSFANEHLPVFWSILAGAAFESAYIGAIALADQQLEDDKVTIVGYSVNITLLLWWASNLCAVIFSILSNLLFASGGTYATITRETATHAIPAPLLAFVYGLLVHNYTSRLSRVSRAEQDRIRKELEEKPYQCDYCSARYTSIKQRSGHMSRCTSRPPKR